MKNLVEDAKKRKVEGGNKGRESKYSASGSAEPQPEIRKRTNEVIADMAGTSKSMVAGWYPG